MSAGHRVAECSRRCRQLTKRCAAALRRCFPALTVPSAAHTSAWQSPVTHAQSPSILLSLGRCPVPAAPGSPQLLRPACSHVDPCLLLAHAEGSGVCLVADASLSPSDTNPSSSFKLPPCSGERRVHRDRLVPRHRQGRGAGAGRPGLQGGCQLRRPPGRGCGGPMVLHSRLAWVLEWVHVLHRLGSSRLCWWQVARLWCQLIELRAWPWTTQR